jgi:hypothetical protein
MIRRNAFTKGTLTPLTMNRMNSSLFSRICISTTVKPQLSLFVISTFKARAFQREQKGLFQYFGCEVKPIYQFPRLFSSFSQNS